MADRFPRSDQSALAPEQEDRVLPDFCDNRVVLILMLVAEASAIVLTLSREHQFEGWLLYLANSSLFIQTIALTDAVILCYSTRWIRRVPVVPRMVLLYLVLQLVTAGATLAAHTLVGGGEFGWQPGGDLGAAMLRNVGISAIITGVMLRYFYVRHQHALREQAEERMRIEALQARIRPHFLFNSLNTIASLIHRRPDEAEEAVLDLAELFRSTFGKKSRITLAEELDIVRRYLAMEQLRLGGRLQVLWDIPPALDDIELPALVVQPLAENAIYHGIEPLAEGGSVRISARREVDTVHIQVSNPRPGGTRPAHARGNRVAMDNIRQRLTLAYGRAAALKVEETPAEYCVTLILPVSGQTG